MNDTTTIYSMDIRGRKIVLNEPIEVPKDDLHKAQVASAEITLPQEVLDFLADIIEALNDKIKEKNNEQT